MTLVFVSAACIFGMMSAASADVSKMYLIRDFGQNNMLLSVLCSLVKRLSKLILL